MPKSKTRRKVRQSQRVKTLREYVVVESIFLSMQMATKFDQTNKIKKLPKNKRNRKNNLAKNFLFRDAAHERIFKTAHERIFFCRS